MLSWLLIAHNVTFPSNTREVSCRDTWTNIVVIINKYNIKEKQWYIDTVNINIIYYDFQGNTAKPVLEDHLPCKTSFHRKATILTCHGWSPAINDHFVLKTGFAAAHIDITSLFFSVRFILFQVSRPTALPLPPRPAHNSYPASGTLKRRVVAS